MPPLQVDNFEKLRASGDLPTPRGVALAIIGLTRRADVSINELARVISGDPAFVGRLIKAANGLVAGSRRTVVSVNEALMVCGLPAVRTMALGFSLLSDYRTGVCQAFDYNRFWVCSLLLGVSLQVFAQRTRVAAADELFSLGLLLRVGELGLATVYPDDYTRVLEQIAGEPQLKLVEAERSVFAISHVELGAAMLADWGLPQVFIDAAGHYSHPAPEHCVAGSRAQRMALVVMLAHAFADLCFAAEHERHACFQAVFAAGEAVGIERDALIEDGERILVQWRDWGALLKFELPPGFSFEEGGEPAARQPAAEVPTVGAAAPATPSPPRIGGRRALVVESDVGERQRMITFARRAGLEAIAAGDHLQALDQALELNPQIICMGVRNAEQLEMIRSLRSTRMGKPMYVLLVVQGMGGEALMQAFDAGADDVLVGPLPDRILAARLQSAVRVVALQEELLQEREELRRFAAELAVSNRRLKEAAMTDSLTGFRNRRYANERLEQAWLASLRDQRPLSCLMLDFDGLKSINDRHGHAAGDAALVAAAEALAAQLRRQEIICRMGGDEFLVICPGASLADALNAAERLRAAVEQREFAFAGRRLPLSLSVGVAQRDATTADADALVRLADQGAYLAKEQGRNRVVAVQSAVRAR